MQVTIRRQRCRFAICLLAVTGLLGADCVAKRADAQQGRFDLLGPKIDVHVTRGTNSLPIASVPNLLPGDKLYVHADLPTTQSTKLILVVAFLRGTTNPPPEKWFTRIETWDKKVRSEGVTVTVPNEAQQALLFVAPETGGDFATLKNAVRGRPGVFVRASQDLNEASFEQSRTERYVKLIKRVPEGSSTALLEHSHKLAATLNLKPNEDCFKRPADQQLSCLSQSGGQLLLDDGHGQTMAQMITSGATSDLIGAVANTPAATASGIGYSAYVGTVLDLVRLMSGLHTAKFQYIPALTFPDEDAMNLRLNVAPSFHDPKSVIVIPLPAIQKAIPPPLQLQNAEHVSCLLQPHTVLPLNGAPLVFATGFAHDLVLHLDRPGPDGRTDLPLVPDAFEGGLVVTEGGGRRPLPTSAPDLRDSPTSEAKEAKDAEEDTPAPSPSGAASLPRPMPPGQKAQATPPADGNEVEITGTVRGYWGFDPFDGPKVPLQRIPGSNWTSSSHNQLFAGRTNTLVLRANGTACTREVELSSGGPPQHLEWKQDHPASKAGADAIAVKLPLEKVAPGGVVLNIHQYGTSQVDKVAVTAYSDAVRAQQFLIHAGDNFGTLLGTGIADITSVQVNNATYLPFGESSDDGKSLKLQMAAVEKGEKMPVLKIGDHGTAQLTLHDGRVLQVPYNVDHPRPAITLLRMTTQPRQDAGLPITLGDKNQIPLTAKVSFAIRSESPAKFPRSEKIELATTDGALHTLLSLSDGSLVLQDKSTALGFLTPEKVFGTSAFGPIQLRAVTEDGTFSDWVPLGTLIRMPVVQGVSCSGHQTFISHAASTTANSNSGVTSDVPVARQAPTSCILSGSNLFLIQSVAPDSSFNSLIDVPPGYDDGGLAVPRPSDNRTLFLKLRDDPDHVISVQLDLPPEHHIAHTAKAPSTDSKAAPADSKAPAADSKASPSDAPATPAADPKAAAAPTNAKAPPSTPSTPEASSPR